MDLNNSIYKDGLVKTAYLEGKGFIRPIVFNGYEDKAVALMNPSIYNDNGQLRCVVRGVNYILHHSEKNLYPHWAGPLQYIHPEADVRLATENYLVDLNDNLEVTKSRYIEMRLNVEPKWGFHGLEDARLVRWDNDLYLTGVRRDTTDNGQGRMELSKIDILNDNTAYELTRERIPASEKDDEYCEKNWMPIIDSDFTYVKWTYPTEIASYKFKYNNNQRKIRELKFKKINQYVNKPLKEIRGGTHVIRYKDYYIALGHTVDLWKPLYGEKDSVYLTIAIIWDKDFNLLNLSDGFSYLNANIEFSCGIAMANNGKDFIISFAEMDQVPYLFQVDADWLISKFLSL